MNTDYQGNLLFAFVHIVEEQQSKRFVHQVLLLNHKLDHQPYFGQNST